MTEPAASAPLPAPSDPAVPGPTPAAASTVAPAKPQEEGPEQATAAAAPPPPPPPLDTEKAAAATAEIRNNGIDEMNPHDFGGEVQSNNELPSAETLRRIENYAVLDRHGKSHTFKSLYSGRNVARRVLVIFVRHFFCGNCQEYLRTLSASITPEALLGLPISTFIAVVGCGDPGLIDLYRRETGCPFPIYTDPTRRLYDELGMVKSLALGPRPAYTRKSIFVVSMESILQGIKQIPTGLVTKGGDHRQIGGEFLFEPLSVLTPLDEVDRRIGEHADFYHANAGRKLDAAAAVDASAPAVARAADPATTTATTADGFTTAAVPHPDGAEDGAAVEEKRVTWCHRMRTTRDHAEVPELMEVLGLDGQGRPNIKSKKRWSRALESRKGTGLSLASQMSVMKADADAQTQAEVDADHVATLDAAQKASPPKNGVAASG